MEATDFKAQVKDRFKGKECYTTRETCRVCGSDKLSPLFTLGNLYISDFVDEDEEGLRAPLELVFCENCSLVQLRHTAPQELLYTGFYWYKSGITETMRKALRDITEKAEKMFDLKQGDVVLDIGSNDGTLLRSYSIPGLIKAGVEPAKNLEEEGKKGVDYFISDFWNYEIYNRVVGKKAKIITAIGMFYDMEDPNQFIKDSARALADDGVFIAQLMCLKNMMDNNDIGNICHEHLEYYSFNALKYLLEKNGLEIFDVEINDINGGSYRIYARLKGSKVKGVEGAEERVRSVEESEKKLQEKETFIEFFKKLEENKKRCVDFIKQEIEKGKKVWVFAASTKGNTILQYYGLNSSLIGGASEKTPEKWGKYTVGTKIPIYNEEKARKVNPDYFLVLPYAFIREFYDREKEWRDKGGKFLVPLPQFSIVDDVYLENLDKKYKLEKQEIDLSGLETKGENEKKVLILGITGQDGSYLAELLLEKGYEVHGMYRKSATGNIKNIKHILDKITLHKGNLTDPVSIYKIIDKVRPEEIYNEADQDHVSWSFDMSGYSYDVTGAAVGRILEMIKLIDKKIKFFQPLSSNMFGKPAETPQTETTDLNPQSPYACAKCFAFHLCKYYRQVYGLKVYTAIFYNHESPRRTEDYVTHKITKSAIRIKKGLQKKLYLGDLSTKIDWGYAKEYMEAAWNIMQLDKPDDFIICTGELHSVEEFLEEVFKQVGLKVDEHVEYDKKFERPGKTGDLVGDYSKAKKTFGFSPKFRFKEIVRMLIEEDEKEIEREEALKSKETSKT